MKIRRANISDYPKIAELFQSTILETCKEDYNQRQLEVWSGSVKRNKDSWLKRIDSQYFIVMEEVDELIGFASIEEGSYIDMMYVHHEHQGKGVAKQLFRELIRKALEKGSSEVTSDVSETAKPFFERQGFKVLKRNDFDVEGVDLHNYKVVLLLESDIK